MKCSTFILTQSETFQSCHWGTGLGTQQCASVVCQEGITHPPRRIPVETKGRTLFHHTPCLLQLPQHHQFDPGVLLGSSPLATTLRWAESVDFRGTQVSLSPMPLICPLPLQLVSHS